MLQRYEEFSLFKEDGMNAQSRQVILTALCL